MTWDTDPARFVCNAIQPAEVSRVIIDAATHTMQLIVTDDKLSLAIGKKGQNVRLASQLTGWRIDIHSESKVREMETRALASLSSIEGITAEAADALFKQGWRSAREVARTSPDELVGLPGIADAAAAERVVAAATRTAELEEKKRQQELQQQEAAAAEAAAAAVSGATSRGTRGGQEAARGGAGVSDGTAIFATGSRPGADPVAYLCRLSPDRGGLDAGAPGPGRGAAGGAGRSQSAGGAGGLGAPRDGLCRLGGPIAGLRPGVSGSRGASGCRGGAGRCLDRRGPAGGTLSSDARLRTWFATRLRSPAVI